MSNGKKVGVVGSGLVGKSWAMIFASQGYQVKQETRNMFIVNVRVKYFHSCITCTAFITYFLGRAL